MRQFLHFLLWGAFTIMIYMDTIHAILPECTFTTTSGFCTGMAGRFIRRDHNPKIRALYIVNSDLSALTADDFAPFQSLSTLHINNCTLPLASERSLLSDLKDLNALQITHSNLSDDIRHMFVNNTALKNLSLQRNKITQIRKETFGHLRELNVVDISNNEISKIDEESFINLKKLKKLVLIGNKIGEHFDPAFLSALPGECGVCSGECPADVPSRCEPNDGSDHVWRLFKEKYDIVFLQDNPICDKIENKTIGDEHKNATSEEAQLETLTTGCPLYQGEKCAERKTFFLNTCKQDPNEMRRAGRNHDEDLESAPEIEDLQSAPEMEEDLESSPEVEEDDLPAARNSVEGAVESTDHGSAEGGDQHFPAAGAGERPTVADDIRAGDSAGIAATSAAADDEDYLPSNWVDVVDGPQTEEISQTAPRSVVIGAVVGVVAAVAVGAALVVFLRTKRSYRTIQQEEDSKETELKVIKIHEAKDSSSREAAPFIGNPMQ